MTFLKKTTFLEQFYVHREIEQKLWRLPIYSLPPPATSLKMVHLEQLMSLCGHITITQSAWFTLGSLLLVQKLWA